MKKISAKKWTAVPEIVLMAMFFASAGYPVFRWLYLEIHGGVWPAVVIWTILCISLPASYLITQERAKKFLHRLGEMFIGAVLYLAIAFWLGMIVLFCAGLFGAEITEGKKLLAGRFSLLLFVLCYGGGVLNAFRVKTTHISIKLPIPADKTLRIALISDLHLGFSSDRRMSERIVSAINSVEPDAVLIAGDIFDMEYDVLRNAEKHSADWKKVKSRYGVFACEGNHDLMVSDGRKDKWIRDSGIVVLCDEAVNLGYITLIGRRDVTDILRVPADKIYAQLANDIPTVTLDHNPQEWRSEWAAGAELLLCGHTHGGQTFPLDLVQKIMLKTPIYGLKTEKDKKLFVTSGAGFWGPPLRLFVNTEVVCIDIVP